MPSHRQEICALRALLAKWSQCYASSEESSRLISAHCLYLCRTITRMEQELITLED